MRILLPLISLAAALWTIYEVWSKNYRLDTTRKLLWTAAAILFSILTAIVYYFWEKPKY